MPRLSQTLRRGVLLGPLALLVALSLAQSSNAQYNTPVQCTQANFQTACASIGQPSGAYTSCTDAGYCYWACNAVVNPKGYTASICLTTTSSACGGNICGPVPTNSSIGCRYSTSSSSLVCQTTCDDGGTWTTFNGVGCGAAASATTTTRAATGTAATTTGTTSTATGTSNSQPSGLSGAVVGGAVAAAIIVVGGCCIGGFLLYRRRSKADEFAVEEPLIDQAGRPTPPPSQGSIQMAPVGQPLYSTPTYSGSISSGPQSVGSGLQPQPGLASGPVSPVVASSLAAAPPSPVPSVVPVGKPYVGIFDYAAQNPDELNIKVGDDFLVLEVYGDGWCLARRISSGEQGVAPFGALAPGRAPVVSAAPVSAAPLIASQALHQEYFPSAAFSLSTFGNTSLALNAPGASTWSGTTMSTAVTTPDVRGPNSGTVGTVKLQVAPRTVSVRLPAAGQSGAVGGQSSFAG